MLLRFQCSQCCCHHHARRLEPPARGAPATAHRACACAREWARTLAWQDAHLAVWPAVDAVAPAHLLQAREADAEALRDLLLGEPEVRLQLLELNRALRNDDPSLDAWAPYLGLLLYSALDGTASTSGGIAYAPRSWSWSVLPSAPQTVYRGLAMPQAMGERYREGERFYWQNFVSTSKRRGTSESFAASSVSGDSDGAFLFVIELPPCAMPRLTAPDTVPAHPLPAFPLPARPLHHFSRWCACAAATG